MARIWKFTASLSLACLLATGVPAQSTDDPHACVSIQSDTLRLACFDAAFAPDGQAASSVDSAAGGGNGTKAAETAPALASPDTGKWQLSTDKSAMTDDQNVFLRLTSENPIAGRFGNAGNGLLLLRCMENTTAVVFRFNDQFMASIQSYGVIEYRIDKSPIVWRLYTQESTDNMALGLWRGRAAIPFIKSLLGHETLLVRATPFNESPVTLTYDISGIDNAIAPLRKTCRW